MCPYNSFVQGDEAKTLWLKLRNSYRDARRRQMRCMKSGAAPENIKPWRFQQQISFLEAVMSPGCREGNVNDSEDDSQTPSTLAVSDDLEEVSEAEDNLDEGNVTMRGAVVQKNKLFLILVAFLVTVVYFIISQPSPYIEPINDGGIKFQPAPLSQKEIEKWWTLRNSTENLSKLGEVLFLNFTEPKLVPSDKKYKILVWRYGATIENRHLKHFSGERIDPFEYCPVKNCDITYSDDDLHTADIVIFHLHRIKGLNDLPQDRDPKQIWAFLTDESPYNTFMASKNKLKDFNNIFNWSMSYRMDTDIPVPYGRTVLKPASENRSLRLVLNKRKDVLVAILGSNCGGQNHRWQYVKQLQKHIEVDTYGGCGTFKKECPGHFGSDCPAINDYLFYLSFENSNCDEYITEKLWWNAFQKNSIPIVMGSSQSTYSKLLPPGSFINIDDFANPRALADYIKLLNNTGEFKKYYRWKNQFKVLNEHGYFQSRSYHYCRICQAMNYNSKKPKVYDHLENYWSTKRDCHRPWDAWNND